MTLLTRISRLLKADIHAILDNLEEPEMILKQAVRDMQDALDKATSAIAALSKQQHRLHEQQQHLSEHIQALQKQLQLCLNDNNELLAKSVIRKKLQAEGLLGEVSRQLNQVQKEKQAKLTETEERKEKLQTIRDKLLLFTEQTELNPAPPATVTRSDITEHDIDIALLYEKQRQKGISDDKGEQL